MIDTNNTTIFINTDAASVPFSDQKIEDMMQRLGPDANEADALYALYETNGSLDDHAITRVLEEGNEIGRAGGFEAIRAAYAQYNLVNSH